MLKESNILMSFGLAVIMFGIGLNIKPRDFRRIFEKPKAILAGLAGQIILLPALAVFIAHSLIGRHDMAMMAILYSSFSFFTTWAMGYLAVAET